MITQLYNCCKLMHMVSLEVMTFNQLLSQRLIQNLTIENINQILINGKVALTVITTLSLIRISIYVFNR